jgi:multicomponent Na+:H+ antiporter subunit B
MPAFGSPDSPGVTVTGNLYLEEGQATTGVANIVTVIIAYYRSFDTLGEITVIFAVGIAIIGLYLKKQEGVDDDE